MNGTLSIEKEAVRWSKSETDAYLITAAVGLMSGILVTFARMPLHMPGHKALWWMTPVLASRLLTRARAGASVGALATLIATLSLGGRIAGGLLMMPMVIVAGAILDWTAGLVERKNRPQWGGALLLGMAGMTGNFACASKRLFEPSGAFFSSVNLSDLVWTFGSYAFFGFLAGVLGAAAGHGMIRFRSKIKVRQGN